MIFFVILIPVAWKLIFLKFDAGGNFSADSNISGALNCNDTNSYFQCGDNTLQCVPWAWICDNDQECNDGSDESKDLCKYSGKCGGNFNSSNGFLTSPSYPDEYPGNADCIYTISRPTNMFIKFTIKRFYLQQCKDDEDYMDYLEIRDGSSEESPLIGRFCESNIPRTIQSTNNEIWMK